MSISSTISLNGIDIIYTPILRSSIRVRVLVTIRNVIKLHFPHRFFSLVGAHLCHSYRMGNAFLEFSCNRLILFYNYLKMTSMTMTRATHRINSNNGPPSNHSWIGVCRVPRVYSYELNLQDRPYRISTVVPCKLWLCRIYHAEHPDNVDLFCCCLEPLASCLSVVIYANELHKITTKTASKRIERNAINLRSR